MTIDNERDQHWLRQAMTLAEQAAEQDEVPVGAVVVLNDEIIGQAYNSPISDCDPTAHAEILALRDAAKNIGNYRLIDATLYVTLEPCMMCAAAMVHARIKRLVFGAHDPKTGAVESCAHTFNSAFLNHKVIYQGGLMAAECGSILQQFFQAKRRKS